MSRHFSYFSFKRSIALAAWLVNENLLGQVSPYHAKNEEINIFQGKYVLPRLSRRH